MTNQEFRKLFETVAQENGFIRKYGCLYKENSECFFTVYLQKSGYGNLYYLHDNIYIKGAFNRIYEPKTLKKWYPPGHVAVAGGKALFYHTVDMLNFEKPMEDVDREAQLRDTFTGYIVPFMEKYSSKKAIWEGYEKKEIRLLDNVKKELERLMQEESEQKNA